MFLMGQFWAVSLHIDGYIFSSCMFAKIMYMYMYVLIICYYDGVPVVVNVK